MSIVEVLNGSIDVFFLTNSKNRDPMVQKGGYLHFCFFEYVVHASMHMHNHADLIHSIIYISLTSVTSGRLLSPRLPMDQSSAV